MMLKQTLLAAAIAVAPMAAFAGGSIDLFYTDNTMDIDGAPNESDGNGYGLRGQAELGNGFSMTALHQNSRIKPGILGPGSNDLSETRVGISYKHALNKQFTMTGTLEKVQVNNELLKNSGQGLTLNGYAVNMGLSSAIMKKVTAYASLGYVNLGKLQDETVSGYEYTAGLSYDLCPHWAGFAEYRVVKLNTDAAFLGNDTDIDNDTLRLGARYTF